MDKEALLIYLRRVLDVEQTIYMRDCLINQLKDQIKNQPIPIYPGTPTNSSNTKPTQPKFNTLSFVFKLIALLGSIFLYLFLLKDFFAESWMSAFMVILLTSPIAGPILFVTVVCSFYSMNKQLKEYRELENSYQSQMNSYYKKNEEYSRKRKIYERELEQYKIEIERNKDRKFYLKGQIKALEQANKESQKVLDELYSYNILYYSYRNIIAVSAIIEYLESGRCSSLDGDYGAYNKFDDDFNQNTIISLLRTIIENQEREITLLNQINNSVQNNGRHFYRLQETIKNIDTTLNRIDSSLTSSTNEFINNQANIQRSLNQQNEHLRRIKINSDITAYNQERSRKEIEYLRLMDDLQHGRWWNP